MQSYNGFVYTYRIANDGDQFTITADDKWQNGVTVSRIDIPRGALVRWFGEEAVKRLESEEK